MSVRGLFSLVLKNFRRPFGNFASTYRIFGHGESASLLAIDPHSSQDFHLSSLAAFKGPDPPKRPLPAFTAYVIKRKDDMIKKDPGLRYRDVLKAVAVDWKTLSVDEKKPYLERSENERAEFKTLKEKWWNNLTDNQKEEYSNLKREVKRIKEQKELKKTLVLLGKPKRPANAYAHFLSQLDGSSIKPGQKLFNYGGETWKSMSEADKQPFVDKYKRETARYKKEMVAWEAKMLEKGYEGVAHPSTKLQNQAATGQKSNRNTLDSTRKVKKSPSKS